MIEPLLLTAMCVPHGDPNDDKTKMGLPVVLWGPPGIGKSERVESVSHFLHFFMALVFPSTCAPEDFSGIPIPDGEGGVVRVCPMRKVRELCDIGEGVLFIDELTTVGATVQAALMGVILNRIMGDLDLPPKVRPILAANPPETATGGHDASTALANRCCHINVQPPALSAWLDWNWDHEIGRKSLPESMYDAETKVKKGWTTNWAHARSLVSGFLQAKGQSMLYSLPEVGHPQRNRAYQTHRSWYYAESALATCFCLKSGDSIEDELIEGCVGEGAGTEFRTWRNTSDLPTPQDMLANGWKPDNRRLDRSLYAYSSLCGYVSSLPPGDDKIRAGGKAYIMLKQACEAGLADLLYRSGTELMKAGVMPSTMKSEDAIKAANYVMSRFKNNSAALKQIAGNTP